MSFIKSLAIEENWQYCFAESMINSLSNSPSDANEKIDKEVVNGNFVKGWENASSTNARKSSSIDFEK